MKVTKRKLSELSYIFHHMSRLLEAASMGLDIQRKDNSCKSHKEKWVKITPNTLLSMFYSGSINYEDLPRLRVKPDMSMWDVHLFNIT